MKKIYWVIAAVLLASGAWAQQAAQELMIINPGRETFLHFPSSVLGNQYTLTVFLPEDAVPLSKRYPVVYLLGAGPQLAQQAQQFMEHHKALVVGVNFQEKDYQNRAKIIEFISRELMPYIDTNYLTYTDTQNRVIAAKGKAAALTAMELFAKPNLFGKLSLASSADAVGQLVLPAHPVRIFVSGSQAELAYAQEQLEGKKLVYGRNFALRYVAQDADLFAGVDEGYLFAAEKDTPVKRLTAKVDKKTLPLEGEEKASLQVKARLQNGEEYDFVPVQLRISPPYLQWTAAEGVLSVLAGAEKGTVKIRGGVDKKTFEAKIKLKKQ